MAFYKNKPHMETSKGAGTTMKIRWFNDTKKRQTEILEIKSAISLFHLVLVKIIRERQSHLRIIVPRVKNGLDFVISVQTVPKGMRPGDEYFVVDESVLAKAMVDLTFNPSDDQIEQILQGE